MYFLCTLYTKSVFVSALTVEKTNAMQSFLNYHRVYRLLKTHIVLSQKYIEFLSVWICPRDANKQKALDSAEQTV